MRGEAMTNTTPVLANAAMLAEAFDRAFAVAPAALAPDSIDLIGIRLGGDPFALRLADTTGMFSGRVITPMPSAVRELRGIAGIRGALVPVYDLAELLGRPPARHATWLVVARQAPVAFVFEVFERQIRLTADALAARENSQHVREVATADGIARPIIDLSSLVAAVGARAKAEQQGGAR